MNIFENVVRCLGDGMTQVLEDVERGAPVTRSQMLRLEKRIQELEKRLEKYEGREVKEEDKDKDCNVENGSEVVGVIGGASAVYANQARDEYFGLSDKKEIKTRQLNSIINNNIFRLEKRIPNLATIVLSQWQKRICKDWYELYGIKPSGLETFVIQERLWDGRQRDGACYRAAGWDGPIGISKGYSNKNVRKRKITNKYQGSRKLVYCKRIKGVELNTAEYETAWGNATKQALLDKKRKEMFADPLDLLIETIRN